MKIVKLDPGTSLYFEVVDLGEMLSFSEKSLIGQILSHIEHGVLPSQGNCLVFSESEKRQIEELSKNVIGGIVTDRGHGHMSSGFDIFIIWVFAQVGLFRQDIPADGNGNQRISDVKDWLLAAHC